MSIKAPNGKVYKTAKEMCEDYNIKPSVYYARKQRGASLERCLTGRSIIAPNGKRYRTEGEMCRDYNINPSVYNTRKNTHNMSLEECLYSGSYTRNKIIAPNGKVYNSESEMCRDYNININVYSYRKHRGESLEDCLADRSIIAPNGIRYRNEAEMCKAYKVSYDAYRTRRDRYNMSIEKCLYGGCYSKNEIIAPNGVLYESEVNMCKYYGADYGRYATRKSNGYPLEVCLYKGLLGKSTSGKSIKAPNGKIYNTIKDLCADYNIRYNTFRVRRNKGWSLEECLTGRKK